MKNNEQLIQQYSKLSEDLHKLTNEELAYIRGVTDGVNFKNGK